MDANERADKAAEKYNTDKKKNYDRGTKDLPPLTLGSKVVLYDVTTRLWDTSAVVTEILPFRRYGLRTDGGRSLTRNRVHLRVSQKCGPTELGGPDTPPFTPREYTIGVHDEESSKDRRPLRGTRAPERFIEKY